MRNESIGSEICSWSELTCRGWNDLGDRWGVNREELFKWIDRLVTFGVARSWVAVVSDGFRWFQDCRDTKITRRNVYYLLTSRLGADLGPIRSEFRFDPPWLLLYWGLHADILGFTCQQVQSQVTGQTENGPKMSPKWSPNTSKICPRQPSRRPRQGGVGVGYSVFVLFVFSFVLLFRSFVVGGLFYFSFRLFLFAFRDFRLLICLFLYFFRFCCFVYLLLCSFVFRCLFFFLSASFLCPFPSGPSILKNNLLRTSGHRPSSRSSVAWRRFRWSWPPSQF